MWAPTLPSPVARSRGPFPPRRCRPNRRRLGETIRCRWAGCACPAGCCCGNRHRGHRRPPAPRFDRPSGRSRVDRDAAFDFVVAVHELVTNAVLHHGGGHGRLELSLQDRTLICSISDHGSGVSGLPAGPPPNDRPGGRGLYLARQLTGALLIDQRGDGVTATVELPAAA
ncbi:ATP-binding protein [Polymorphospora sp. NPDC051019]|uniref:ATP-binding protein n=1 Tax=Polymorphospora sp. NPDC051019 TaxID=3155725 RepID=UPI00342627AB